MRWLLTTCFFLLHSTALIAQLQNYRIDRYTAENGLESNSISYILQDHQGNLWFRTEVGVARYDGYHFQSFGYDPNNPKTLFQKVRMRGLYLDARGNVWLDYSGIGVSYFDQEKDKFVNFHPDESRPEHIGNYDIQCFYSNEPDIVWIGTDRDLFKFDYRSETFERFDFGEDLPVKAMMIDNIGNLWLGTGVGDNYDDGLGLYHYDIQNDKLSKIGTGRQKINDIHQDQKGGIWLATNNGIGRVRDYSPGISDLTQTHYVIRQNQKGNLADTHRNNVTNIFEASDGSMWFLTSFGVARAMVSDGGADFIVRHYLSDAIPGPNGQILLAGMVEDRDGNIFTVSRHTAYGLCQYDPVRDEFEVKLDRHESSVPDKSRFVSLFLDRQNVMWMGTERHGLFKLDLDQKRFQSMRHVPTNPNSMGSNIVYSIEYDNASQLWFGTANGVTGLNLTTGKFEVYNTDNSTINDDVVFSTLLDTRGRLWLGHSPSQVSRMDLDTWENTPFRHIIGNDTTGFFAWTIESIVEDVNDNVWVSSHNGQIFQMHAGEIGSLNAFPFEKQEHRNDLSVNVLYPDQHGQVWVGTTYGLYRYSPQSNKLEEYQAYENERPFREGINTIKGLSNGFWIGSQSGGLVRLDTTQQTIVRVTMQHGLSGNSVSSILAENDTVLWVSTNGGLSRMDLSSKTFTNFTTADGLPSNTFLKNSAVTLKDGTMFFGSSDGVLYFHPRVIRSNPYQAQPIINELKLFNKQVIVGDTINGQVILPSSLSSQQKVVLNHKNNILALGFSSMHFASPDNNRYAYRLEPLEEKWNYVDAESRTASYTSLPPGSYLFRVRATNSDGRWSDNEAHLQIVIEPPWWNTTWFRLTLLLLVIALSYLLYRLRVQNIRSRNRMLEKMVEEKTVDLKEQNLEVQEMSRKLHQVDQEKIRFFMNVSHEFRTPLTLIMGPITNLMKSKRIGNAEKEDLRVVERNAHRMLRLTNQLLDANDLEKDTLRLRVGEGDIVHFVKEIVAAFDYRAHFMNVDYRFECNLAGHICWFDGDKIEKILFNLISNAFKFTDQGGRVIVSLHLADDHLRLSVEDTGIGIESDQLAHIFERFYQVDSQDHRGTGTGIGLNLAKKLAQKHRGDLTVQSKLGEGSTFFLTLPVGEEDFNQEERVELQVDAIERAEAIQKLYTTNSEGVDVGSKRSSSSYVILIVEDSIDMRDYLKGALKTHYSILEAKNGEEGLKVAEEMVPDLIISDVMMPKIDGMELCYRIKSSDYLSHIPIILLTAKVGEENQMDGYQIGADDYLAKPFDLNLLRIRVSNLINNRVTLRSHFEKSSDLLPDQIVEDRSDKVFMEKLIRVIDEHLSDPSLNYQHFVDELGIGKTKLYERINKVAGQSINLFIRTIRLKKAAKLIEEKQFTFSEISYKVGFSDPSYFSKCFRQQFNLSPKEYQEQHQVVDD